MKMIMVILPRRSGEAVLDALIIAGYRVTFNETRGGMLRQSQLTLFIGVNEQDVDAVLDIIKAHCKTELKIHYTHTLNKPDEIEHPPISLNEVVFFIWDIERFEKL